MSSLFTACRPWVTAVMLASLSSCSITRHDPQVNSAKHAYLQTRKTYVQGAAMGAVLGAGPGAVIGRQIGNKSGGFSGAIIGAAVGGIGGLAYANHVVKQRQAFATAAAYLQACTEAARAERAAAASYNATLTRRITAVRGDSEVVSATIQDSKVVLARLKQEIDLQESVLSTVREAAVSNQYLTAQAVQIGALKAEQKRLETSIERLSQPDEPTVVGGS